MTNEQREAVENILLWSRTPVPDDSLELDRWLAHLDLLIQDARLAIDVEWAALRNTAFALRIGRSAAEIPPPTLDDIA